MSNKPLKAGDQKKLNTVMQRKKKLSEAIPQLPPYTYIVSEGTKTEPYYILGFADAINKKYSRFGKHNRIQVKGIGKNTKHLLEHTRKIVDSEFPETEIVWLMYDKDDFPDDNFDNTQFSAEKEKDRRIYKAAWSNECIELWFLLHFEDLTTNTGRDSYRKKLKTYFDYKKNCKNIYDILKDKTADAVKRAKKQYNYFLEQELPPHECCPSTRVFELVEELQKYL